MIFAPSTPHLIEEIAKGLEDAVSPKIIEPDAKLLAGMAAQVLRTLAVRCENERAWMREERAAIESYARALLLVPSLSRSPEASELAVALDELASCDASSLDMSDAEESYRLTGVVLSRTAAVVYSAGGDDDRRGLHRLFVQRLAHENQITGGYQAVGRS